MRFRGILIWWVTYCLILEGSTNKNALRMIILSKIVTLVLVFMRDPTDQIELSF